MRLIEIRFRIGLIPAVTLMAVTAGLMWATAASNTVPESNVVDVIVQSPITANDLKPPECAALNLVSIVVASDGDNANNLVLGTAGADTIKGKSGDDCILGGGGDDDLLGGKDNDILLGGFGNDALRGFSGDDTLIGGADVDVCTGGPGQGNDTYDPSCETQN